MKGFFGNKNYVGVGRTYQRREVEACNIRELVYF